MESSIQFDMMSDWASQLLPDTPAFLSAESSFDEDHYVQVLPGLSPAGGGWECDPSPTDEIQRDSLWSDPLDVLSSSPGLFGDVQYLDDVRSPSDHWKLSSNIWYEENLESSHQYKQIDSTDAQLSLGDSELLGASPGLNGAFSASPMDVKFEFGDVFDQSLSYLADTSSVTHIDVGQVYQSVEYTTSSAPVGRPIFDLEHESLMSTSPLDDCLDDDDSLHDAESVCQLLRELDDSCHRTAHNTLSHVSAEEVDLVLSRGSSSENLAALDEQSSLPVLLPAEVIASSFIGAQCSITSPIASPHVTLGSGYKQLTLTTKLPLPLMSRSTTAVPYGEVLTERKIRKKEQNKTAALRYRQKKREEKGHTTSEVEELVQKNAELKNRADELTKEIDYLKKLLEEIKGQ